MRDHEAMKYQLIHHAQERVREMGIGQEEVFKTLTNPKTDYPSHPSYNQPGEQRRIATSERLAVVYEETNKRVITVLWNRMEGRDNTGQPTA